MDIRTNAFSLSTDTTFLVTRFSFFFQSLQIQRYIDHPVKNRATEIRDVEICVHVLLAYFLQNRVDVENLAYLCQLSLIILSKFL